MTPAPDDPDFARLPEHVAASVRQLTESMQPVLAATRAFVINTLIPAYLTALEEWTMALSPNDPVEVLLHDGPWIPATVVIPGRDLVTVRSLSGWQLLVLAGRVRPAQPPADEPIVVRAGA